MFLHFDRCFPESFFILNVEALSELDGKSIRERDIISVSAKYHGHIWRRTKENSCWSIVCLPASNGMLMLQLFCLSNSKLCLLYPRTDLLLRLFFFQKWMTDYLKSPSKWLPLPHANHWLLTNLGCSPLRLANYLRKRWIVASEVYLSERYSAACVPRCNRHCVFCL